jgi:hypothetical protein
VATAALSGRGVADDAAVLDLEDAVGEVEDAVVVGDDDDGAVRLDRDGAQQVHDAAAGAGVERRGRLVADDQPGIVDQRAGDGDALLLPAGQLARQALGKLADVELLQRLGAARDRFGPFHAGGDQRHAAFSAEVSVGIRLYCWKMKPILASRNLTSAFSPSS